MNKYIENELFTVEYKIQGKGNVIVFLHGYLEAKEIWDDFIPSLTQNNTIITIDLPSHGKSICKQEVATMELLAQSVNAVLENENIAKATLIGHSMGGYVTLAFLELFPHKLNMLSLLHSHPFADTELTKENRLREIDIVKDGRKELLINTNIPKAFATKNLETMSHILQKIKQIALQTTDSGIIAALKGMRERRDRHNILSQTLIPFIYVFGEHDNYISEETFKKILMPKNSNTIIMENSGHNSFLEETELLLNIYKRFL